MKAKKLIATILSAVIAIMPISGNYSSPTIYAADTTVTFNQFDMSINDGEPIRGVDISSILSLEEAGVKFYNEYGKEQDIFKTLAEHNVNYIRVRVWNEPYDSNGNSYGGGNCDLYAAAEIGRRAAEYDMKLLVDIQYSDFWADPGKQTLPKYWQNHDHDTLKGEIYKYTTWVLETVSDAGADIGMVQVGNETNCFFCGETDMYKICDLFASGNQAVRDFNETILIAHHFANPSTGYYAWYAQVMNECNLDYDVFATSYYPYWHGTAENMTAVLKEIADAYDKYVMVAETAYPYTMEDGDTFGNAISEYVTDIDLRYDVSVEGQAQCLTDVFQAVANVGSKGIGVFYWEPAWIGVSGLSYYDQKALWEQYGSGWATDYAAEYDTSVTGVGGSSYDNQGLFDFSGKPLDSLAVFRNIYPQNTTAPSPGGAIIEDGTYCIRNMNSGLFISDKNGNAVQSSAQIWTFSKTDDDAYTIRTPDGRALTVENNADSDGTNISLQPYVGDASQQFILSLCDDGSYALLTVSSSNVRCLDVYNISLDDGANICQWEYWGGSGQKFYIEPVTKIMGDANADGKFSEADAAMLQHFLLKSGSISDWTAADLTDDNKLDAADLAMMKRLLIYA